ncbi:MAG: hypothetical protein ABIH86_05825, partial [Planctomycetota bacterium]
MASRHRINRFGVALAAAVVWLCGTAWGATYEVSGTVTVIGDATDLEGAELRLMNGNTIVSFCSVTGGAYSLFVETGTYSYQIGSSTYLARVI